MGIEIERKFLVTSDRWRRSATTIDYRQGYLTSSASRLVRVRIAGEQATLTIKSRINDLERNEFEYSIPLDEAKILLDQLCEKPIIEKQRHLVQHGGHTWEIDEFQGANQGLIVAEIELDSAEEKFKRPDWLGEEVSHDPRYLNVNLQKKPYSEW